MTFRTSSYSNGGDNCVEISDSDDVIAIRDSKIPHGPMLRFPPEAYRSFIAKIIKETL
ncbi:DUF397 domain-containing protein [Streptomyces sp. NPDC051162]|uniref:DUF397 domain-containing protein n=1 Tax=unclassified Streptomyces TaxID=2593676 RepID=UPI0034452939